MTDFSREYRKKHLANQLAIADRLKAAMVRVGDKAARIVSDPQAKFVKSFDFRNNPHLNKIITGLITEFQGDALKIIETGIVTSWAISNDKNDRMVQNYIQNLSILKKQEATYLNTNQDALKSFIAQKKQGKTLSEKVWQSAEKLRDELEVHLGYGIANGDSAVIVSRRIRDYLINPEALFRRVRDEAGKLQLSTAAKQFHPGQGVYRSAYKNAFRVARSETNRAYLYSDHLRWQKQDFVIGVNVELSEQHPTPDICDHMQGDYPKGYVFTGWHPACLCHATPILMPREKFKKYLAGEQVEVNEIVDVPQGHKDWVSANKQRVEGWKSKPYFIRDNYKDGDLSKGFVFKVPKGIKTPAQPEPTIIEPVGFVPAKTKAEAISQIDRLFVDNLGIKPKSIEIHDILTIDQINARSEQLTKLFSEYEPTTIYSKNVPILNVKYKSGSFSLGQISSSNDGTILHEVNFGSRNDPARINKMLGFSTKSKVDANNLEISTLTHEFAHLITTQSQQVRSYIDARLSDFMPNLRTIKSQYTRELNSLAKSGKTDEIRSFYLGDYASTNINEFMAEAFTEYKLNSNPSKYAKLVGELIDKTFKRK